MSQIPQHETSESEEEAFEDAVDIQQDVKHKSNIQDGDRDRKTNDYFDNSATKDQFCDTAGSMDQGDINALLSQDNDEKESSNGSSEYDDVVHLSDCEESVNNVSFENKTTNLDESVGVNSTNSTSADSNKSSAQEDSKEKDEDSLVDVEEEEEAKNDESEIVVEEEMVRQLEAKLSPEEKEMKKMEAQELKSEGNELFKAAKYPEAIEKYTQALITCPLCFGKERSIMYSNRGACYIKQEKYKKCIENCTKSIEINELYIKPLIRRAECYEKTEKLDEALEDYNKALQLDPSSFHAREACMRLPEQIKERNEKLKDEMMDKLKDLGNLVLRPFGLSTENFKFTQDPNTGGYSVNFNQGAGKT